MKLQDSRVLTAECALQSEKLIKVKSFLLGDILSQKPQFRFFQQKKLENEALKMYSNNLYSNLLSQNTVKKENKVKVASTL